MSTRWANLGEDAGALHALVELIPAHVPVERIDYLWIFPPRRVAAGESIVIVVGGFDDDANRRRVFTLRFTVARNRKGSASVTTRFDEHGAAPATAVPRIVQGVLRRLGEEAEADPREEPVGGSSERWDELIVALGGRPRAATDEAAATRQNAAPAGAEGNSDSTAPPAADPASAARDL